MNTTSLPHQNNNMKNIFKTCYNNTSLILKKTFLNNKKYMIPITIASMAATIYKTEEIKYKRPETDFYYCSNIDELDGWTYLHDKAYKGTLTEQDIENLSIDEIDIRDDFGQTPLFWAVHNSEYDAAVLLLNKGADINQVDGMKRTLLHITTSQKIAVLLLSKGVKHDQKDKSGMTAMDALNRTSGDTQEYELRQNVIKAINIYVRSKIKKSDNKLLEIVDKHNLHLINISPLLNLKWIKYKNNKWTLLHVKAHLNTLTEDDLKNTTIQDLDIRDKYGRSPLFISVENGFHNQTKMLLNNGANPLQKNNDRKTLFHVLREHTLVDLLLKHGVKYDEQDNDNRTALDELRESSITTGYYDYIETTNDTKEIFNKKQQVLLRLGYKKLGNVDYCKTVAINKLEKFEGTYSMWFSTYDSLYNKCLKKNRYY